MCKRRLVSFKGECAYADGFGVSAADLDMSILRSFAAGRRNSVWQLGLWKERFGWVSWD